MNTPEQPKDAPLNELTPPLRAAVDAARTQPVCKKSQQRALKRAAANRPPRLPWLRRRRDLLAITSIAALFLLAFGLLPTPQDNSQVELLNWHGRSGYQVISTGGSGGGGRGSGEAQRRLTAAEENRLLVRLDRWQHENIGLGLESELPTQFYFGREEEKREIVRDQQSLQKLSTSSEELGAARMPSSDEPPIVFPAAAAARNGSGVASSPSPTTVPSAVPMPAGKPEGLTPGYAPYSLNPSYGGSGYGGGGYSGGYTGYSGGMGNNRPTSGSGTAASAGAYGYYRPNGGAPAAPPSLPPAPPPLQQPPGDSLLPEPNNPLPRTGEAKPGDQKAGEKPPGETERGEHKPLKDALAPEKEAKDLKNETKELPSLTEKSRESKTKDKSEPKPKVWRRNGAQPTMARVYVGDGNSLDMVSLQVTVTIDGPRARTVVDHVFRNPHDRQLEGTFEYPLPTGASPSYFAMFLGNPRDTMPARFQRGDTVRLPTAALARQTPAELVANIDSTDWGRLQEAHIVGKDKAKETYEDVVRGRIDPALLEYASGNTFRGRVFPIAPKGYNRVILAYEELLPLVEGQLLYRFALPDLPVNDIQFALTANTKECKYTALVPRDAKKESGGNQVTYSKTWKDQAPEERFVLFAGTPVNPAIQAVCGQQGENGPHHLYARLRPELKKIEMTKAFASHAVFLLDTSLSENGDRFNTNMKLLKKILESDADIKQFNILTFNVGSAWVEPQGWLSNDAAGREKALSKLDGIVLEGATDLDAALTHLRKPEFAVEKNTALNVFVLSDGHITWGETDTNTIVSRYETNSPYPSRFYCYRVGMGAENAELFDALARNGGGVFNCLSEPELNPAAMAHRNLGFTVESIRFVGGPEASDVLLAGRKVTVHPGGELVVAARLDGPAKGKLLVDGKFQGDSMTLTFPLDSSSRSELAARAWAEVAVGSLLALNDPKLDPLVTAYCQQYGVASRAASFLVLENEADYKRLNLEEERGKTVNGDLGLYIQKLWRELGATKSARQAYIDFLQRIQPRLNIMVDLNAKELAKAWNNLPDKDRVKAMPSKLLAALKDSDFELTASAVHGAIVRKGDVPPGYLTDRSNDRRNVGVYLKEAQRRADDGDRDGAIRVLSSVIEEHAGRGDALRLVGYRLLDMHQADQAAHLFQQVQRERPFEPQSYRDLARSLEDCGLYGLAALEYEIVLSGTWHARFHNESLKQVVLEEYAHMMQDAIRRQAVSKELTEQFGERLEGMTAQQQSDLRVTISWNTDATDVDLWVFEPDGTKVFYSNPHSKSGGQLSQDQTQGYGPERYQVAKALPGEYKIMVHYFNNNPNLLSGETHVNVVVTRFAGTPRETSERRTVILKQKDEQVEVCKVKF